MSDDVTLTRNEYENLVARSDWLGYLEQAGVDNWEGYGIAQDYRREAEGEEADE